jgi:hypothetical protein
MSPAAAMRWDRLAKSLPRTAGDVGARVAVDMVGSLFSGLGAGEKCEGWALEYRRFF